MSENELLYIFSIMMFIIAFSISTIILLSTLTNRRIQLVESRNKRIAAEELEKSLIIDAEMDQDLMEEETLKMNVELA